MNWLNLPLANAITEKFFPWNLDFSNSLDSDKLGLRFATKPWPQKHQTFIKFSSIHETTQNPVEYFIKLCPWALNTVKKQLHYNEYHPSNEFPFSLMITACTSELGY